MVKEHPIQEALTTSTNLSSSSASEVKAIISPQDDIARHPPLRSTTAYLALLSGSTEAPRSPVAVATMSPKYQGFESSAELHEQVASPGNAHNVRSATEQTSSSSSNDPCTAITTTAMDDKEICIITTQKEEEKEREGGGKVEAKASATEFMELSASACSSTHHHHDIFKDDTSSVGLNVAIKDNIDGGQAYASPSRLPRLSSPKVRTLSQSLSKKPNY